MGPGRRPDPDDRRWTTITVAFKRELYDTITTLRLELTLARTEIRDLKDRLNRR